MTIEENTEQNHHGCYADKQRRRRNFGGYGQHSADDANKTHQRGVDGHSAGNFTAVTFEYDVAGRTTNIHDEERTKHATPLACRACQPKSRPKNT